MSLRDSARALDSLQRIFGDQNLARSPDHELLAQYLSGDEMTAEFAFEVLVARHGPMVLRVCRRILGNSHEAEDATQATFLVLAQRASSIRKSRSLASWLFGVASRVSARARVQASRRRRYESRFAKPAEVYEENDTDRAAWQALLEEVEKLPERYRCPMVMFHLKGLSYEDAAYELGCSPRTIQTRLARGRERLRTRLTQRGLARSANLVGVSLTHPAGSPLLPAGWAGRTAHCVLQLSANLSLHGTLPVSLATITKGMSNSMGLLKLKVAAALSVSVAVVVSSATASSFLSNEIPSSARPVIAKVPSPSKHREPTRIAQAKTKPASDDVAKAQESTLLKRDEGKSAGMRSIAGSGHAVRFDAPGEGWKLTSVSLYGSRYGYPKPPKEDFEVYLCDENFHKLATFSFPYSTFQRGEPKWVTMEVKPTAVPAKFFIAFSFNPERTKGVYVHFDPRKNDTSFVGIPDEGKPEPFAKGNWMIRARLSPASKD